MGTLLYYGQSVNSTMPVSLGTLEASTNTQYKEQDIAQIINYCATQPYDTIRFHHSDMGLKIHSDAS